jgi:hypothetical protein
MSRGPCTFKQRDVTQALKAAMAAGIKIARYEIDRRGTIVVIPAHDVPATTSVIERPNGWEDVV